MTSPLNEKALEAALRAYGHECNSEETYDGAVPAAIRAYLSALPVVSDEEVALAGPVFFDDRVSVRHLLSFGGYDMGAGGSVVSKERLRGALSYVDRLEAELTAARAEIEAYEHAASYDPMMSGEYRFKGWNRSKLDRARRITEERRAAEALRATKKDAAP